MTTTENEAHRLAEVSHADVENWMHERDKEPKLHSKRKAKVGDVVLYYPSEDQEYDEYARNNNASVVPALVTAVWSEDCVNLTVFPDAPFKTEAAACPASFSITSACKLPEGTHNSQTGMWDFK
jgi:hypothetical protein